MTRPNAGGDSTVTGIVLAGGMSSRLGRNKALEPVAGEPLLLRVIGRLSQVAGQTVVVLARPEAAQELPLPGSAVVAVDMYPGGGSLGGIFTGLTAAGGEWGVVVACDMPFLNVSLLKHMLLLRDGFDAVVPVLQDRPEPTHAVYSKACLPHMEARLQAGDLKIARFFDDVRVNYVPQTEVDKRDPEHLSFFNVNTQQDLDRALSLVEEGY
jgi:molybdopterin-guanine dinucleotide biosynthesis protein A